MEVSERIRRRRRRQRGKERRGRRKKQSYLVPLPATPTAARAIIHAEGAVSGPPGRRLALSLRGGIDNGLTMVSSRSTGKSINQTL